jgi:hypothetical protein
MVFPLETYGLRYPCPRPRGSGYQMLISHQKIPLSSTPISDPLAGVGIFRTEGATREFCGTSKSCPREPERNERQAGRMEA